MRIGLKPNTINLLCELEQFRGSWTASSQLISTRLKALQSLAAVESSAAAVRLAGFPCRNRQVGEFLTGRSQPTESWSERAGHTAGSFHASLKLINTSYEQIPPTENNLRQLHALVIGSGLKMTPRLPFQANPLESSLREFRHLSSLTLHPIISLSALTFRLWSAKPFETGNRRLICLLIRLLLLRGQYPFLRYCSFESELGKRLVDVQFTGSDPGPYRPEAPAINQEWLALLLKSFCSAKENLIKKIAREKKLLKLAPAHLEIIRVVQEHGQASISVIQENTGANRNTIKIRIRKMVALGLLSQKGHGKATFYTLPTEHPQ